MGFEFKSEFLEKNIRFEFVSEGDFPSEFLLEQFLLDEPYVNRRGKRNAIKGNRSVVEDERVLWDFF